MKKLLLLLVSLLLTFNSYGEWTKVTKDDDGDSYYIDLNTIKKNDGYVYWWDFVNYVEPDDGFMSLTSFLQGDCEIGRSKILSTTQYTESMLYGEYESDTPANPEWDYFPPETIGGYFLELSCNLAEHLEQISPEERERILEEAREYYQIEQDNPPYTVISIDKDGNYYINPMDESIPEAISFQELINLASERMMANPEMKVLINADKEVNYGKVLEVVTPLKKFNNSIGFLTEAPEEEDSIQENLTEDNDNIRELQAQYVRSIAEKVKSNWRYQGAEDDWTAEVYIVQDRDGTVVAVDVRNANVDDSSKAKVFKDSIRRAVYKASPLPSAPDEAVFDKELIFKFGVKTPN